MGEMNNTPVMWQYQEKVFFSIEKPKPKRTIAMPNNSSNYKQKIIYKKSNVK